MENDESEKFESGEDLRKVAELRCQRRLTEDEWKIVDPYDDWTGPRLFTATDLNELVSLINTALPILRSETGVPTVSAWGMIAMSLLTITLATLILGRSRAP